MKKKEYWFNIRVYGLILNEKDEIILADEQRFGTKMTKFPGGGLRYGEGTIDCLKREAREELGEDIEIISHFYTTDIFQQSFFHKNHQLIAIYYLARFVNPGTIITEGMSRRKREKVVFRYRNIHEMNEEELSFPIDRLVLRMLKSGQKELM